MSFQYFVEEIPWLWRFRQAASLSVDYTLDELTDIDLRLDALLEALFYHRTEALEFLKENIDLGDSGEVAMYACLLGYARDFEQLTELTRVVAGQQTQKALIEGLRWLPPEFLSPLQDYLLNQDDTLLGGLWYHLLENDAIVDATTIGAALTSQDEFVILGALRNIIRGKNSYYEPLLQALVARMHGENHYQAVKALLLLGSAQFVQRHTEDWVGGKSGGRVMVLLSHALPVIMSKYLDSKSFPAELTPSWIESLGVLGNPASIPRIIAYFEQFPNEAVLAIQAISGVDVRTLGDKPARNQMENSDATEDDGASVTVDLDEVVRWWDSARGRLMKVNRLFWGVPFDDMALVSAMREGNQRQRASAALSLAFKHRTFPLLDVEEHGLTQRAKFINLEGLLKTSGRATQTV